MVRPHGVHEVVDLVEGDAEGEDGEEGSEEVRVGVPRRRGDHARDGVGADGILASGTAVCEEGSEKDEGRVDEEPEGEEGEEAGDATSGGVVGPEDDVGEEVDEEDDAVEAHGGKHGVASLAAPSQPRVYTR